MIVVRARSLVVASERRCVVVDQRCRESEGKAKIEGYMSVCDEEAHQWREIRVDIFHKNVVGGGKSGGMAVKVNVLMITSTIVT